MSKLPFPERILHQHIAVLGKTGSGKSSALRVIAEHLLGKQKRTAIVDPKGDWWGLKSSADGKGPGYPVIAFGDFKEPRATDVPINDRSGKHVAELIATGNRPCIIGFRGWMPAQMVRFWLDFAPAIFNMNEGELYAFISEVQNFAPKGKIMDPDSGRCVHWTNRIMSEGRGLGLTFFLDSQRSQKVHNDTLDTCETLIAMRTVHPAARQSIKDWIDGNGDPATGKEVLATLAQLKRGEAWVWSPENSFGPERVQFPMFETFDSFAPPQLQKKVSQAGWSEVNLDQVREKLASVIAEAKANDPKELKAEILRLKSELAKTHHAVSAPTPQVDEKAIERAVHQATTPLLARIASMQGVARKFDSVFRNTQTELLRALGPICEMATLAPPEVPAIAAPAARPRTMPALSPHANGRGYNSIPAPSGELSGPQVQLVQRLFEFHAIGRDAVNLAWLAGSLSTTVRSRGFEENLRKVRASGLVDVANQRARLTDAGVDTVRHSGFAADGAPAVKSRIKQMLSGPQVDLLETLDEVYPHGMPLEALASAHNTTVRARGFEENIRFLRSNEIIEVAQGVATRAEWVA